MIGFITTPETAAAVLAGIDAAMDARGLPNYWSVGSYPIHSGPHAGMVFIPGDDTILATPLHGKPVLHPPDFPEFGAIVGAMGGLDARIEIPAADLTSPDIDP